MYNLFIFVLGAIALQVLLWPYFKYKHKNILYQRESSALYAANCQIAIINEKLITFHKRNMNPRKTSYCEKFIQEFGADYINKYRLKAIPVVNYEFKIDVIPGNVSLEAVLLDGDREVSVSVPCLNGYGFFCAEDSGYYWAPEIAKDLEITEEEATQRLKKAGLL